MLSRAEQTLPASGANAYRVAELRSGPPSLRAQRPKHPVVAYKTSADPSNVPTPADVALDRGVRSGSASSASVSLLCLEHYEVC